MAVTSPLVDAVFLHPQETLHANGKFQWSLLNYAPITVLEPTMPA